MKTKTIIFLFFLLANSIYLFAQDDVYSPPPVKHKKEHNKDKDKPEKYPRKINSGFVFIDGKYIEPPYIIKIKNNKITMNNISVLGYKDKSGVPKINRLPDIKLDSIKGWEDLFSNIEIKKVISYFFCKYNKEKAINKVSEFVLNLPYIDTAYYFVKTDFLSGIIFKPLDIDTTIMLPISWSRDEIIWNKKLLKKNKIESKTSEKEYLKDKYEFFVSCLMNNGSLFFQNGKDIFFLRNKKETSLFFNEVLPIINEQNINNEEKIDKLKKLFSNEKYFSNEIIMMKIDTTKKLKTRLKKI